MVGTSLLASLKTSLVENLPQRKFDTSSTYRELLGVRNILTSFGAKLRGETISLYTDNSNVSRIIQNGSTKNDLQTLAISIFNLTIQNNVTLKTHWIPREQNTTTDFLSKLQDTDNCTIDHETFAYIHTTAVWQFHRRPFCR